MFMREDKDIRFSRSNFSFLRFFCMLFIFLHHYTMINGHISIFSSESLNEHLNTAFDRGFYLNFVFFTLSGYCLNRAYTYHTDKLYTVPFKTFFKKRFLSLYPGAALTIVFMGILHYVWYFTFNDYWMQSNFTFLHIPAALAGLQAFLTSYFGNSVNNPTWFVFMLILCQVVFWLLGRIRKIDRRFVLILSTLLVYLVYLTADHYDLERLLYSHFCFFLGCLVEYFSRTRKNRIIVCVIVAAVCIAFFTYPFYLMLFIPSLLIILYEDLSAAVKGSERIPRIRGFIKDISFPILLTNFPSICIVNYTDRALSLGMNYSSVLILLLTFAVNTALALPVLMVQKKITSASSRY